MDCAICNSQADEQKRFSALYWFHRKANDNGEYAERLKREREWVASGASSHDDEYVAWMKDLVAAHG